MGTHIKASHVFLDNPAQKKEEALAFLSEKAVELGVAGDKESVLESFLARESLESTGMVDGFAIPHAKSDSIEVASVLVVRFASGIDDWSSLDGKSVKAAIALLVPSSEAGTTHLKLLAKTAVLLMDEDFRRFVNASDDPSAIADRINEGFEDDESRHQG